MAKQINWNNTNRQNRLRAYDRAHRLTDLINEIEAEHAHDIATYVGVVKSKAVVLTQAQIAYNRDCMGL